ncbi:MAG: methyltransferase domain-containing protein [Bryobacteraceae bacterium]
MANERDQLVLADLFEYFSVPFIETHPDRLATLGFLKGLHPAPIDSCRVLEVGCGAGANLLGMAYTLPKSRFLGIDLGRTPIEKANRAAADLGFDNVRFVCQNLLDFDPGGQTFDYVVAHGFYSWVPAIVREKLMEIIAIVLAPHGIAYISYNAYPGGYGGDRIRDLAMFHCSRMRALDPAAFDSPEGQIRETARLLHLLVDNYPAGSAPSQEDLFFEAKRTASRPPVIASALIYHDILADCRTPFTLSQVEWHAQQHGLQVFEEAIPAEPDRPETPGPLMDRIREAAAGDPIIETQYIDHLVGRAFRRTLLCRSELPVARRDEVSAVALMYLATDLAETAASPDGSVTFTIPKTGSIILKSAAAIAILRGLIAVYPQRVAAKDVEFEGERANSNMYSLLVSMYRRGWLSLFTQPSPAGAAGPYPLASALGRYQAGRQEMLGNLLHERVALRDGPWFLNLLDGSRNHAALLEELTRRFPDRSPGELTTDLHERLDGLRELALLHAG